MPFAAGGTTDVTARLVAGPMALAYYESVGQNWERAAMIKARAVAGDIDAGEAWLQTLRPFVYRRYLDFTALDGLRDACFVKRYLATVPLNHYWFHVVLLVPRGSVHTRLAWRATVKFRLSTGQSRSAQGLWRRVDDFVDNYYI